MEQAGVRAPRQRVTARGAARILARRDPVIAAFVEAVGLPRIGRAREDAFTTLVRSITSQQLAGSAARAIYGRLAALLDGDVAPAGLLAVSRASLREAGLSGAKAAALHDLAAKVSDGSVVLEPRRLAQRSDEEIVANLSTVRGVGRWSAEMFLIFRLGRLDVWPTGDLAVRRGFAQAWQVPVPTPRELDAIGERYRPYRSVVAWYCWHARALPRSDEAARG